MRLSLVSFELDNVREALSNHEHVYIVVFRGADDFCRCANALGEHFDSLRLEQVVNSAGSLVGVDALALGLVTDLGSYVCRGSRHKFNRAP